MDGLFEKIKEKSAGTHRFPPTKNVEADLCICPNSKIVFDTETTSLDIMKAKLVWISIYLDDDNIFYINRMHSWPKINNNDLKDFLKNLFNLNILIIGHNIKYDLEIIKKYIID